MTAPDHRPNDQHAAHPAAVWLRGVLGERAATLTSDSRAVRPGDVFLAWPGARADARRFIPAVIAQGAAAVLWDDADGFARDAGWSVPNQPVTGLKAAAGAIAADWYGRPSTHLLSVGVTGTSGKSSCALWIAQTLTLLGRRCAVAGTLGVGFADAGTDAFDTTGMTTPDPVALQTLLAALERAGARALALEVSSIGLEEGRVNGMHFDIALYTNLSRDHLDYHRTMDDYAAAKARLFAWPGLGAAVINLDDAEGERMDLVAARNGARVLGYSARGLPGADLRALDLVHDIDGMRFDVLGAFGRRNVVTRLIGRYNVANLLGVLGVLLAAGHDVDAALAALAQVEPAPGRLQRIAGKGNAADSGPLVLVDYAHKPDALENALQACRPLAEARGGRLVVVFGCGGDRDPGKRPLMGEIAARLADAVMITSDNPRSEDALAIMDAIAAGIVDADARSRVTKNVDRRAAIAAAIGAAQRADVVLIAGKGHETYQDIAGVKWPFSDAAEAGAILQQLEAASC